MKIVLDTNVLVSGLLNPYGPPGELVRMASAGVLVLCHDPRILTEYRDVLHRQEFGFRRSHVTALLDQITVGGHPVTAEPLEHHLRDRDDEMFLEVALSGGVRYLVTGNHADYKGSPHHSVSVVSPAQFLEQYRAEV